MITNCRDETYLRSKCYRINFHLLSQERWEEIPFIPGYSISSIGRIKHRPYSGKKERFLCPSFRLLRYMYVTVTVDGKRKGFPVDRLMISAFHRVAYKTIRKLSHINNVKYDNRLENLSYSTWGELKD